jgi:hypothetical protein
MLKYFYVRLDICSIASDMGQEINGEVICARPMQHMPTSIHSVEGKDATHGFLDLQGEEPIGEETKNFNNTGVRR